MDGFMRWGLDVGQLFGIRIKIHWTLFILLAWYLKISLPNGFNPIDLWWIGIFLGTILLHELGHCFAARSTGGQAYEIILWPLGGLAMICGGKQTPRDWIWVAIAGPLMHLPISLICATFLANAGHPVQLSDFNPLGEWNLPGDGGRLNLIYFTFKLQVVLFCLNMVPAYPLDGGQIMLGLIATVTSFQQAAAITGALSMLLGFGMLLVGFQFIAIWVLLEGWNLLHASQHGGFGMGGAPRTRVFKRLDQGADLPRPRVADEYLRPCPHCQKPIHVKAERCTYCDQLVTVTG
jgi:Zn-dependent protease